MDSGADSQRSASKEADLLLRLETEFSEAICDLHVRLDRLSSVCSLLSCSLGLLENRVQSLERMLPCESTDLDLHSLD